VCGIAGILAFDGRPVAAERIRAMTDALHHRGPDDEGFHLEPGVALGMRRLAIIDLAAGHQPVGNEDGGVQVVFNGEIYNYRELRRALEARGHRFATASDTEVLVHAYEEHGDGCVERLRGMFAFAIWDARRRRLLVARDRIGIKPLYYAHRAQALLFASEVKSLVASGEVARELDWGAVDHLFGYLTTPPAQSILAGVAKLEPGHLMIATAAGDVRIRRYWRPRFEPDRGRSEAEWSEAIGAALDESVRLHLLADVPVGAFLSGGVDSTAVVGAVAGLGGEPLRTYSIGFRESEFDELRFARLAAERFGTRHREEVVEPDVLDVLDDLAWHLDEPFGDSSAIPTYMVSRLAAREVKVVLSGDGGDELFAGYDRYRVEGRERLNRFLPRPFRALLGAVGRALPEGTTGRELLRHTALTGAERYLDAATLFRGEQKLRLFAPAVHALLPGSAVRPPAFRWLGESELHWLSALQLFDLETYLPLDILAKVDRMSMAHSIEARVPLLDHPLIELAARIPPELQMRHGRGKHLFKRALRGRVPDVILGRPKQGFAVPLGRWFRGRLGAIVRELLLSERARRRGIFDPAYLERLVDLHARGRELDLQLWTLVSFELWCRTYLDAAPAAREPQAPRPPRAVLAWSPRDGARPAAAAVGAAP
jgi:asparagine synthase (glutamine-hydrolysing)